MNAHETFYLAQRAHNLLQPLIAEAAEQGIKVMLHSNLVFGTPFGSPLTLCVWEVQGGELVTIVYQTFYRGETLKEHEERLDGLVEHTRNGIRSRIEAKQLVNA